MAAQNIFYESKKNVIHLWDDKLGYQALDYRKYAYMKARDGKSRSMFGDKVTKVYHWDESDEENGLMFESDIFPETRVLIDRYLNEDDVAKGHKELFIDIEISMRAGIPSVTKAKNEITSICIYDKLSDEYSVFVLSTASQIPADSRKENQNIYWYDNEYDLLKAFLNEYISISPTIITGWNIDYFDIPYLYNRITNVLGEDMSQCLSPIGIVKWDKHKEKYKLAGVSCLDYLRLYKTFTFSQKPSYSLEAIATEELGYGKIDYDGTLDELYKQDIDKFVKYNVNDVKLVVEIDDKLKFIELAQGISHKGHTPYEDIYFSSRYLDGALLTYLKRKGVIAPNRNKFGETKDFSGAYVKEPVPGKYDWVFDLDLASLYPSIIRSLNISPETKVGKVEAWNAKAFRNIIRNKEHKTYKIDTGKKSVKLDAHELNSFLDEESYSISSLGVLYKTDTVGLIPMVLDEWAKERQEYRDLMKRYGNEGNQEKYEYFKARQIIQKVLLNSMYGVLGLASFRFYDLDNAESVTVTGQEIIKFVQLMGNHYYNKTLDTKDVDYCIYTDTDSVFFSAVELIKVKYPDVDRNDSVSMSEHIIEIASELQDFINNSFDKFGKYFLNIDSHYFHIKQELISRSSLWVAKKRYAQWIINDNGVKVDTLDIKGLDIVRSNYPKEFRKFMKEMVSMFLHDNKKEEIDEKLLIFKKNLVTLPIGDIATPTSVQNVMKYTDKGRGTRKLESSKQGFSNYKKGSPAHVKAAIMYNNLIDHYGLSRRYSKIQDGEKIKWIYLTKNPFGIEALAFKGFNDPKEIIDFIHQNKDHNKVYESTLKKKLNDFYKAMKWDYPTEDSAKFDQFFTF